MNLETVARQSLANRRFDTRHLTDIIQRRIPDLLAVRLEGNRVTCLNRDAIHPQFDSPVDFWLRVLGYVVAGERVPDTTLLFNLLDLARSYRKRGEPEPASPQLLGALAALHPAAAHSSTFAPLPHEVLSDDVPVFSLAAIPGLHQDLLVPCWFLLSYSITSHWSWFLRAESFQRRIRFWNDYDRTPWTHKRPMMYWRGALNGGVALPGEWRRFDRGSVCAAVAAAPHQSLDIGLTGGEFEAEVRDEVAPILRAREPFTKAWEYRYLLDLDGNSFSSRLINYLGSNALVIRPKPLYAQWYFEWLRPGEHYLLIDKYAHEITVDDLAGAVEWAERNASQAKAMVREANQLMRQLTPAVITRYWAVVLREYAARLH